MTQVTMNNLDNVAGGRLLLNKNLNKDLNNQLSARPVKPIGMPNPFADDDFTRPIIPGMPNPFADDIFAKPIIPGMPNPFAD